MADPKSDPDPDEYTIEQFEELRGWLQERWPSPTPKCPYCGTDRWVVGNTFTTLGPELFPVTCNHCGNTVFISRANTDLPFPEEDEPHESGE